MIDHACSDGCILEGVKVVAMVVDVLNRHWPLAGLGVNDRGQAFVEETDAVRA